MQLLQVKHKMNNMKSKGILFICFLLSFSSLVAQHHNDELQLYDTDKSVESDKADCKAIKEWQDLRFGMFIHWGPISQLGKQLSHSRNSKSHTPGGKAYKVASIEPEIYDIQYKTFDPVNYDPDYIVKLAKRVGMQYLVFTAKHHAGFCMFDSKVTDYDIMSSPYGKDILKELEQACRKNDFGFGFYYSPRDWYHPDCDSENNHDRYIKYYKAQMEELLNNYGSIFAIWFDGMGPGNWGNTSLEVMNRIRKLHPGAIVNDRGGISGDFYTTEHTVSYFNKEQNWESCHTTTGQWGYNPDVGAKSLKQLMEIMLYSWGANGNMLLNIGPRGDGSLNPLEVERLEEVASWWKQNGESIRKSRGGPYLPGPWGVSTRKGNKIFVHVFRWSINGEMILPNIPGRKVVSSRLLNGKDMMTNIGENNFTLKVPKNSRDKIVTTIELVMDNDVMDVNPVFAQTPLTHNAKLSVSCNTKDLELLTDHDATTIWEAKANEDKEIWIEVKFDNPVEIGSVVTGRGEEWHPRHIPELQIPDGEGGWKTILKWKPKWEPVQFLKQAVKTDTIRLLVTGTKQYYLAEFELYSAIK